MIEEPFGTEGRCHGDGQAALERRPPQPAGPRRDRVESFFDDGEKRATGGGRRETLGMTHEQRDTEPFLEDANLLADGVAGDMQLVGGTANMAQPGSGLESLERVERRQSPGHGPQHSAPSCRR